MTKKSARQLNAEIVEVLSKPRKSSQRRANKSPLEIRTQRLKTLQGIMEDVFCDKGWADTDLNELESWISVDDGLSDREWIDTAKNQLIDNSVLPEHAGAPPENVRAWNDVFISTYFMNIDSGMNDEAAIDSARQNANDTVPLAANEHALTKTDPKLYVTERKRYGSR